MEDWQQRTQLLLGDEKMERLRRAHVLVVGLGGVGAYAAEMICRAGVGRMTIVDADTVQPTNINRQLPALHSTLGQKKAEILASRFRDINPALELRVLPVFLKDENIPELLDDAAYDFVGGCHRYACSKMPLDSGKHEAAYQDSVQHGGRSKE